LYGHGIAMKTPDRLSLLFNATPMTGLYDRIRAGWTQRSRHHRLLACVAIMLLLAGGAQAAASTSSSEGVQVGERSRLANLVSAEKLEREAGQQYNAMLREAASKRALAPNEHPQVRRLRAIANRLIPHATRFNPRALEWRWEVNLIGSKQINAFCMPGGKIAFFTGILETLKLTDDEVATIMGHEIAHALREHGRERTAQSNIAKGVTLGASVISQIMGYGDLGGHLASAGAKLTLLKFSRGDETEADLVGMELAARAGFDPRAGIKLWEKMATASKNQPPQWMSTHPSHQTRIQEIRRNLDRTLPLYARATGRDVHALGPYRSNVGEPVQ
jgi:predicted Zn-dependent protease